MALFSISFDLDQQTPGSSSRDMHGEGSVLVKDKDPDKHRFFEVKLFENPYGVNNNADEWPIRPILSSYWFTNGVMSIPDGKSDCSLCTVTCEGCKSMPYKPAFDPSACGYSQDGYTRVHRDKAIVLAMRKWMELSTDKSNAELGIPEGC
jgi:alpha-amylase